MLAITIALPVLASTTISAFISLPSLQRRLRRPQPAVQATVQAAAPASTAELASESNDYLPADVVAGSLRFSAERDARTNGLRYTLENDSCWRIDMVEVEVEISAGDGSDVWSGRRRIRLAGEGWPLCTSTGVYPDVPTAADERLSVRLVAARIDPTCGPHVLSSWEPAAVGVDHVADSGTVVHLARPE